MDDPTEEHPDNIKNDGNSINEWQSSDGRGEGACPDLSPQTRKGTTELFTHHETRCFTVSYGDISCIS